MDISFRIILQTPIDKKYTYGVEIRNPNFLKIPFFDFLERNKIAMVFLQGYYMPPIWEVFNKSKEQIKSTAVIKLYGPDRSGIFILCTSRSE